MNNEKFIHGYEFINKKLAGLEVNRIFNSIGSNVFFEFGNDREVTFSNGKKRMQKEWAIWLGNASWRISKNGKYIVGSDDPSEIIQEYIQIMLGKRFQSFQFLSQFLDVIFNFDEGYQITTFFNWITEDQWTIFLSDGTNMGVDFSNYERVENFINIAKNFSITEKYKTMQFPLENLNLIRIIYDEYRRPTLCFENKCLVEFTNCSWRLERNQDYLVGYGDIYLEKDETKIHNEINKLIGKKIKQVEINPYMDGRFQFEDQYVIKTFASLRSIYQWEIRSQDTFIFQAKIQLEEI